MVRKYLPKKKKSYNDTVLQLAIQAVEDGGKKLMVAKTIGVTKSTLKDKINERRQSGPVAKTVFTEQPEQALINRLFIWEIVNFD